MLKRCEAGEVGPRLDADLNGDLSYSTTAEEYMPMCNACYNMCVRTPGHPLDFSSELYSRVKAVLEKYLADVVRPWACATQRLVSPHRCIFHAVDLSTDCLVLYSIIRTSPSVGALSTTLAGRRPLRYQVQVREYVPATTVPENALHGTVSSS